MQVFSEIIYKFFYIYSFAFIFPAVGAAMKVFLYIMSLRSYEVFEALQKNAASRLCVHAYSMYIAVTNITDIKTGCRIRRCNLGIFNPGKKFGIVW